MPEEGITSTAPTEPVVTASAVVVDAPQTEGTPAEKPAGDTPSDQPGEKPEKTATDEQPEKKGQSRFERRLNKAYQRAAEEKARADLLAQQLEELKPKPSNIGEPRLEDYTSVEEWGQAKADYAKKQAVNEITARQQSEAQKRELAELSGSWEAKAARADGKYDDFDQVVGELIPTNPFTAAIMEADNGEDIAYYLGKNPKEAMRIIALPVRSQIREIGKLEAKLLAEPLKPKTPSSAPAPIKPVNGSSSPSTKKLREVKDYDEFAKRRSAFIAQKR